VDAQTRSALKKDDVFIHTTQAGLDWIAENRAKALRISIAVLVIIVLAVASTSSAPKPPPTPSGMLLVSTAPRSPILRSQRRQASKPSPRRQIAPRRPTRSLRT
jgi:hypothetical protein